MITSFEKKIIIGGMEYSLVSDDEYLRNIHVFEPNMVDLFKTLATGSKTILDIGANIGCTALLFGQLGERVVAFEASSTTYGFLKTNVEGAGLTNVIVNNVGIGAESGETTLTFAPSNRSGGFVSDKTQASAGHTVETISIRTIDYLVQTQGLRQIDFIKIDVEGCEPHVLSGAVNTLATNKPTVVLELNHWCLNAFQRISVPDFFDQLRSLFPILCAVDGMSYLDLHNANDSYVVMYHHILKNRFQNIVAAFSEDKLKDFKKKYRHDFRP